MKVMYWLLGIILGLPLLYLAAIYVASELGGEVVTLNRTDANGEMSQVRIWIVDSDGKSWVEHGDSDAPWITRLAQSPELVLTRAGNETHYAGTPDRDAHDLYHKLRREKYGLGDQVIELLTGSSDDCEGVPVRLQLR
jgi:hypothetical protein